MNQKRWKHLYGKERVDVRKREKYRKNEIESFQLFMLGATSTRERLRWMCLHCQADEALSRLLNATILARFCL